MFFFLPTLKFQSSFNHSLYHLLQSVTNYGSSVGSNGNCVGLGPSVIPLLTGWGHKVWGWHEVYSNISPLNTYMQVLIDFHQYHCGTLSRFTFWCLMTIKAHTEILTIHSYTQNQAEVGLHVFSKQSQEDDSSTKRQNCQLHSKSINNPNKSINSSKQYNNLERGTSQPNLHVFQLIHLSNQLSEIILKLTFFKGKKNKGLRK